MDNDSRTRPRGYWKQEPLEYPGAVVTEWRQRGGAKVPAAECLPPAERVSVRQFVALMEAMTDGEGEPAGA